MKTNSVLTTPFASMYNLNPLVNDAAKWLLTANLDATQDKYVAIAQGINPVVRTPISECFTAIKNKKMLDRLYYISVLLNPKIDIPEILTVNDVAIDGAYVHGLRDDRFKRVWLNISSMLAPPSGSRYAELTVSSSNELMASIVRGMICMSYADSVEWLNPKLASFVIEFYTIMMRTILDKRYRLDLEEGGLIKYAFAYYYASLMSEQKDKEGTPVLLQKCTHLFRGMDSSIEELNERMKEFLDGDSITILHVVEFIKMFGPDRLHDLNVELLYKSLSIVSQNSVATWIAADYPPYLVYLLFLSMSGNKHPILNHIINNMFDKKYIRENVEQLVKYQNLYTGVNRKSA